MSVLSYFSHLYCSELASNFPGLFLIVPAFVFVVLVVILVGLGVFVSTGSSSGLPLLLPVLKPPQGPPKSQREPRTYRWDN